MVQGIASAQRQTLYEGVLQELGREARRFRFQVAPNPCVGAAVLSGDLVVARGFHRQWGGAHAEVDALNRAATSDVAAREWDTLVVTLEPCSSHGKTPPCVERILAHGISRVVIGATDPDPRHRGRGIDLLEAAGVEVVLLPDSSPLEEIAPHFLRWNEPERLRRARPWTLAKWAQTRSGQLIPPADFGEGRWITGDAALDEVHAVRGSVDAIVTGVGTILADDPRLTVRRGAEALRGGGPARVVLDSYLRTPPDARLFAPASEGEHCGPVHILCQAGAAAGRYQKLVEAGAEVHGLHADAADSVDLRDVQGWLWDKGYRRLMLECGPTLLRRYMSHGFVDQLLVYTGPVNGGLGASMAEWLMPKALHDRVDRELEEDSVLEAMLRPDL